MEFVTCPLEFQIQTYSQYHKHSPNNLGIGTFFASVSDTLQKNQMRSKEAEKNWNCLAWTSLAARELIRPNDSQLTNRNS